MEKLAIILAMLPFLVGCDKECDSPLPNCLSEKIDKNEILPNGVITRYGTQNGYVYEIYNGDGADIYDEDCRIVCFLGGIVGNTTCVDGNDTLVFSSPVVVWKR